MGTGISMSSVNKIKELVENGDYSLALDILEHQDLSKSLSPQFVRICGEVYYENEKYAKAREALVRAHSMAPMGNKIIYSIIKLYLAMGLFELAELYFDIYKFNQDTRDVGTVRIEYLIAKAYRKPIIELYSILISANEMETDEEWDLEMLYLHAAMKNDDKLRNESEVFKVTYKNSTKFERIEELKADIDKAFDYIYIYPENMAQDDDVEMEEIRQFENKVLEEDDLRMNPKDPQIMIMVEDDEPIPNSVKFKTMFSRSKENRKEKKEKKTEAREEKTGWFGRNRMSKKDEDVFEETLNELNEQGVGKQELLAEVLKSDETFESENISHEEMSEMIDNSTPEDKAVYNDDNVSEQLFDDDIDDFAFEDEAESVVMVDMDILSEEAEEEIQEEHHEEAEEEIQEEHHEEAEEEIQEEHHEEAEEEIEEEHQEETEEEHQEEILDSWEKELPDEYELEEEFLDESEASEYNLEEFEMEESEIEESEIDESEVEESEIEESEIDESEVEESEMEESEVEESEMEELEIEEPDLNISDSDIEDFADESEITMIEISDMDVPDEFTKYDEPCEIEEEHESFAEDAEEAAEEEPEPFAEDAEEAVEEEPEPFAEDAEETPANDDRQEKVLYKRNIDFPVFKSSLFPDYNRDEPPVYVPSHRDMTDINDKQEHINKNLKKEEDLISETDKLLARLGIELGTTYHSDAFIDRDDDSDISSHDRYKNVTEEKADIEDKNPFKLRS